MRVVAPGSIPRAPGDRVKTDRRDAKRLVRLFAAGELSFAFVPSEADEHFRDLVRCIEDARKDLMRARHRLSKFLLRRGLRFARASGRRRTSAGCAGRASMTRSRGRRSSTTGARCDALGQRRRALIECSRQVDPAQQSRAAIARLRCFRGIDTLSAAGLCAEVGTFASVRQAHAALGVPRDRPERVHLRHQARAGLDHQGRPDARATAAGRGRPPLPPPPRDRQGLAARQAGQDPRVVEIAWRAQRRLHARWTHLGGQRGKPTGTVASRAHVSSPRSAGRPPPWTDTDIDTPAPRRLPGRARATHEGRHVAIHGLATGLWATRLTAGPRPLLDCEPGDEQGS